MSVCRALVVGVDGSTGAQHALIAAARLAAAIGARLVAVYVEHLPASAFIAAPTSSTGALAIAIEEAADQAHMDCELALARHDIAWTFETRLGDPAIELERAANDHDAACIIIGRCGHGRLAHIVTGSVTDRLIRHARRPIVVIPAPP